MNLQEFRDNSRHLPAATPILMLGEDGQLREVRRPTPDEVRNLGPEQLARALDNTCVILTSDNQ